MSEWTIDVHQAVARHISGVEIKFSGNPESSFFDGKPCNFPHGMDALDKVRLIRTGFEAYRKAYAQSSRKAVNRKVTSDS